MCVTKSRANINNRYNTRFETSERVSQSREFLNSVLKEKERKKINHILFYFARWDFGNRVSINSSRREKHVGEQDDFAARYFFFTLDGTEFPSQIPARMRIVVNEDTLLFSPYDATFPTSLHLLYGALHTERNLTDDLVTTATPQLRCYYARLLEKARSRQGFYLRQNSNE